jgi:ubiquinone/menaquinone biosynthesis C-methylase UbiE
MPVASAPSRYDFTSRLVSGALAVPPVWSLAKAQARRMMIGRAERLGIPWRETVAELSSRDWQPLRQAIERPELDYPANYRASFHGYDAGHLCWEAAFEFEVASNAVHSSLYPEAGAHSDRALRQGYHECLQELLPQPPARILDLHATVGLSTFRLEETFPSASITGLDFSPHYLTLARYNAEQRGSAVAEWIHALPEATGLPDGSFDLVSAFLLFHEMPQSTTRRIFREARRLLPAGGTFAFMDMNPESGAYQAMPAFVMTLLKSTEPYMDAYFQLDVARELEAAGFDGVEIRPCTPRHRAVVARVAA